VLLYSRPEQLAMISEAPNHRNYPAPCSMEVISLHRYAVKGLSSDSMKTVYVDKGFPSDRKYALIKKTKRSLFDEENPKWLHKENFLCAFTRNELMASFDSDFVEDTSELNVWKRLEDYDRTRQQVPLLSANLESIEGRKELSEFFSEACGEPVQLITASNHQFGNTSKGIRARGDTRTCHIVNAATVRSLSAAIGVNLNPLRFRPNIVVDGLEPWSEFKYIGKNLVNQGNCEDLKMYICARTVRCDGISVDPLNRSEILNIPNLLSKHFPEHGPYLGVYALVDTPGIIDIGDTLTII